MSDDILSTKMQVQFGKLETEVKHIVETYDKLSEEVKLQNRELVKEIKDIIAQSNDYFYLYENFKQQSELQDDRLEENINDLKLIISKLETTVHSLELNQNKSVLKSLLEEIIDSKILIIIKWILGITILILGADRIRVFFDL